MNIIIRRAKEQDLSKLYEMIREFAEFADKTDCVSLTQSELFENRNLFVCFMAETTSGEIAGYILFFPTFHTWTGKAIYLEDLYVKQDYRRFGVGTRLLNAAIDFAKENGCTKVRWQVYDWNKDAIALYKKIGARVGDNNLNCVLDI